MLGVGEFNFNPILSLCAYTFASRGAEIVFTVMVLLFLVIFCLSLVCFSYYHVSKKIREHNAGVSLSLSGVNVLEINMSKVLFILVFAFTLCWLPTFVVILIIRVIIIGEAPHALAVLIPFLFQASSVVNPFIYGAWSPPFRREFRRLFTFHCAKVSDEGRNAEPTTELNLIHRKVSIHPQVNV